VSFAFFLGGAVVLHRSICWAGPCSDRQAYPHRNALLALVFSEHSCEPTGAATVLSLDGNFAVSSFRKQMARCIEAAERCVSEAAVAQTAFEEEEWLDMAILWMEMAEAFEKADQPTRH
jgi:hypothetical protein